MTIKIFLLRIQFTMDRPDNIPSCRWSGMLNWWAARTIYKDGLEFTTQQRDEVLEEIAMARDRDRLKYRFWDEDETPYSYSL